VHKVCGELEGFFPENKDDVLLVFSSAHNNDNLVCHHLHLWSYLGLAANKLSPLSQFWMSLSEGYDGQQTAVLSFVTVLDC
jgi:hypothetical protein